MNQRYKKSQDHSRHLEKYRQNYLTITGVVLVTVNLETMKAEIDLMDNSKLYCVKDGQLIEHELPAYGQTIIVTLGGKVDRLETTVKRKI